MRAHFVASCLSEGLDGELFHMGLAVPARSPDRIRLESLDKVRYVPVPTGPHEDKGSPALGSSSLRVGGNFTRL